MSAIFVSYGQLASAQSAWLLTEQDSHSYLSKEVNSVASFQIDVGVSAIYGDAGSNLAVLYYDEKQESDILSLIDKASGTVVSTWSGRFAKLNSGPYAGVTVIGKYAYYIAYAAPTPSANVDTFLTIKPVVCGTSREYHWRTAASRRMTSRMNVSIPSWCATRAFQSSIRGMEPPRTSLMPRHRI